MTIKAVYSTEITPEESAADLSSKLSDITAKFIIFFASSKFDSGALASAMQKQFDSASVVGCTTAGEIVSGKMLKDSVVAMAFDSQALEEVNIGVVENVKTENRVPEVFADFERKTGQKMIDLNIKKYVGIILVDGLSLAEEKLMDKIGALTDITFIGGSAGDDLKYKTTYVFAGGRAYTNAAVLVLLKPRVEFDVVKTQSFCDKNKVLEATRVNEAERIVYEFDGLPASEAYANALEVPVEEADSKFMSHPLGLMVGEEPYVRSPQQFQGSDMLFYCNIKEGMELNLLESMDIVQDMREVMKAKKIEHGKISGLINFHCILRTLELEQRSQTEDYGKVFEDVPTIGFSTYGEEYLGHINQTSTMLLFK